MPAPDKIVKGHTVSSQNGTMNEHSSRLIDNNLVPCVLLTFDHKINISLLLLIVGFAIAKSGHAMA